MKIIEILESGDLDQINMCTKLLRKGYLINDDYNDIVDSYDNMDEVPERDNSPELDTAMGLLDELMEQIKLNERIAMFLCDGDGFTAQDGYGELLKCVNGEEYDDSKMKLTDFCDYYASHEDILKVINGNK